MLARILKIIFLDIIPSLGDILSDLLNSREMLGGLNVISTTIHNVFYTVTEVSGNDTSERNSTSDRNSTSTYHEDQDVIWGCIGFFLIFAPGLPMAIACVNYFICQGGFYPFRRCVAILCFICYPFAILITQIGGLCGSVVSDNILVAFVGGEAFFQSSPQMVLQLFTIQYGYQTGPLQIITICLSFFLLAKTAIMFDLLYLESVDTKLDNWKMKVKYVIKVIPVYTTGIVFRIGGLSITIAYLRYWSLILIAILIYQYAVTAYQLGYNGRDIFIAIISNLGSMTRGVMDSGTKAQASFAFLTISSILTFIHQSTCLVSILVMTNLSPSYFSHWSPKTKLKYFPYTNYIISGVIAVGILNLILIFTRRDTLKLSGTKNKNAKEPGRDEETAFT